MVLFKKKDFAVPIFFVLIVLIDYACGEVRNRIFPKNFVSVFYTNSSEKELRIAFKNIVISETSAFLDTYYSMIFHRISDGERLIQTVYQNKQFKDCMYSTDARDVNSFIGDFKNETVSDWMKFPKGKAISNYTNSGHHENVTEYFRHRKDLGELKDKIKINKFAHLCRKFAKGVKRTSHAHKNFHHFQEQEKKFFSDEIDDDVISDDFVFLNPKHDTNTQKKVSTDRKRRSTRNKRSVWSSFLMFPGTKWCGRGQTAKHYNDIGTDNELDECCREHDLCPVLVHPFSFKYHYFNYRFHAVLHCKCDEEFRNCLKQSLSKNANLVGRIYFNIMGSKCLVLRESDVCHRYSWWGTCLEYRKHTVAHVKSQKYFDHVVDDVSEELSNET
ncbi:hypothetical protein FSP39_014024 [Pinctada imbricata]|uniref:Phospholipase A2-like central domain-containing protein n=1 Tax=Pinctada imbricata TaxID=66713 RepID=A0AA89BJE7_PINIB|nr:hypothetical protein FSP39_014024 [Pinctada imbricata]